MPGPNRTHLSDARGATRMVLDAAVGITSIAEAMHLTIQLRPGPLGRPAQGTTSGITGFVYGAVRGGLRLAAKGVDAALGSAEALLPEGESSETRDAFLSAINGVYGDYLARTGNTLAIEMSVRSGGHAVDPGNPCRAFDAGGSVPPDGRLLLMIHGLCRGDRQWRREGHDHGAALSGDLGFTPLYLRYNSGLHVASNGRTLSELLETLLANWPRPVEELAILGHSMGGLVARSACHHAAARGHAWLRHLRKLVFLGTPHHGAPLERGGHWLDSLMELSPYAAPFTRLGRLRSAGITDLRHGSVTTKARDIVPLPKGVPCYAAAATLGARRGLLSERLIGDGLVPLDSALGRHADPERTLAIPASRQWIGYRMGHLELLHRPEVYARLRSWLEE